MSLFIWCFQCMFFSSVKEINSLISKEMSNIYYWIKLTFSKLVGKENFLERKFKECTSFEEQKGTRYIRWNVYFGIIVFSCFLSKKRVSDFFFFFLICFAEEIKGFYQNSFRNEVDFRNIMETFPQTSWLKIKMSKK